MISIGKLMLDVYYFEMIFKDDELFLLSYDKER